MECTFVALNNGPSFKQKNQTCLNTINNTPDGKFYNFFSYASSVRKRLRRAVLTHIGDG
jgi:hypothetical protein